MIRFFGNDHLIRVLDNKELIHNFLAQLQQFKHVVVLIDQQVPESLDYECGILHEFPVFLEVVIHIECAINVEDVSFGFFLDHLGPLKDKHLQVLEEEPLVTGLTLALNMEQLVERGVHFVLEVGFDEDLQEDRVFVDERLLVLVQYDLQQQTVPGLRLLQLSEFVLELLRFPR